MPGPAESVSARVPCSRATAYATDDTASGSPLLCDHVAYDPAYAEQNAGADTGTTYAMAMVRADAIGAYRVRADRLGSTPGDAAAYASAYAVFSVLVTLEAQLRWDFEDEDPGAPFSRSSFSLTDYSTGTPIHAIGPVGGPCAALTARFQCPAPPRPSRRHRSAKARRR